MSTHPPDGYEMQVDFDNIQVYHPLKRMNLEEYEVMYQVEDHHWWYLGMEQITCHLLDRYLPRDRNRALKILDAGCGTGAVMKYLCRYGEVTGFDFSAEALRFSQKARAHPAGPGFGVGDSVCQRSV